MTSTVVERPAHQRRSVLSDDIADDVDLLARRDPTDTDDRVAAACLTRITASLRCFGRLLAELHADTSPAHVRRLVPRPSIVVHGLPDWVAELPPMIGQGWAVASHPAIRRSVLAAQDAWEPICWVHGGRGEDVTSVRDGWELAPAGRGDPTWDIASAVDWSQAVIGAAIDPAWGVDPGRTLMTAYRSAGGVGHPTIETVVARCVQSAVDATTAALDAGLDDQTAAWLRALWARPLALVADR